MRVNVNQDMCIGCGMCVAMQPEIFQMNADGKAESITEIVDNRDGDVQEAVNGCPVSAIFAE